MGLIGPWAIMVCPTYNRVKPSGMMGCTGAHEDAHKYAKTVRIEVVPSATHQGAVGALREVKAQLARIGSPAERESGAAEAFVIACEALDRIGGQ